MNHIYNKLVV